MTIYHDLNDHRVQVVAYHTSGEMVWNMTVVIIDLNRVAVGMPPGQYMVIITSSNAEQFKRMVTIDG